MALPVLVLVLLLFTGEVRTVAQCSTERTSNIRFNVRSAANGTGHRLVQVKLLNKASVAKTVDVSIDHWTAFCGSTETVSMDVDVFAPVVDAELTVAPTELPTARAAPGTVCREGYEKLPGVGCYKEIKTYLTWQQARDNCESYGDYLAIPDSQQELKFFQEVYKRPGSAPWLGISKIGDTWMTITDHVLDSYNFTTWISGNPTNRGDCIVVVASGLMNIKCSDASYRSICEQRLP